MMRFLFWATFLLAPVVALAQKVASAVDNVVVYTTGALVTRVASVDVRRGTTSLSLEGLSTNLDPQSIRVGLSDERVSILSVKHEFDTESNPDIVEQISKDERRKEALQDSISVLQARISVLTNEKSLILNNQKIGGSAGVTSTQLAQMTKFFFSELTSIENNLLKYDKRLKACRSALNSLVQASNNNSREVSSLVSRIRLSVKSDVDVSKLRITLSYLVFDAQWSPFYEVRVRSVQDPLKLVYSARVKQSTGEDWNNVRLALSTGEATMDNTKPEFETIFLPSTKRVKSVRKWARPSTSLAFGQVVDEMGNPVVGCSVMESGTTNGTVADFDGVFKLSMKDVSHKLQFSFVGYESQELDPGEKMFVVLKDETNELEEVQVVAYGTQKKATLTGSVAGVVVQKAGTPLIRGIGSSAKRKTTTEKNVPMNISESLAATEFKIDLPYSIPSDGKDYDVVMLTYGIDADYKYLCAPRYSDKMFLVANIMDSYQFNLQPGVAKLYFDNVYQGESSISPLALQDTLSLSVGVDKHLTVERKEVRSSSARSFLGGTVKVKKAFEITVRNNKDIAVNVEVEDQYPVPQVAEIKVALIESSGADVDPNSGKLTWHLSLAPHESKKLKLSYEIKSPSHYSLVE